MLQPAGDGDDCGISQEGVPPGYEAIALLDALNGTSSPPQAIVPPDGKYITCVE